MRLLDQTYRRVRSHDLNPLGSKKIDALRGSAAARGVGAHVTLARAGGAHAEVGGVDGDALARTDDDARGSVAVDDRSDEAADDDAATFDGYGTGCIGLALRGDGGRGVDQDGRLEYGRRLHADLAAALMTDAAVENRAALPRG